MMTLLSDVLPIEDLVQVEEEPALEIALPQVFTQPDLTVLQRGKLHDVEQIAYRIYRTSLKSQGIGGLGPEYQELVNEFQPLFTWAVACWDYLLSTEGCRFVLRHGDEKLYTRGDYRAVTDRDYSRLVHRIFRQLVLEFSQAPTEQSLNQYLRVRLWDAVVHAYRTLEDPPDPHQRTLTPYSYLRCIPYRFLNDFHHELVARTLQKLPHAERQAIDHYFLRFLTLPATAHTLAVTEDLVQETLRRGLLTLLIEDRLVYCLLRQIERY